MKTEVVGRRRAAKVLVFVAADDELEGSEDSESAGDVDLILKTILSGSRSSGAALARLSNDLRAQLFVLFFITSSLA